jgi:ATP-dependent Clp protease adapter protein ClpS
MAENLVWPKVREERAVEPAQDEATILVNYDSVTPASCVILGLRTTFALSDELAEHIAWVARTAGAARVVTRPRTEAENLLDKAEEFARLCGPPLTFSLEQEACVPQKGSRKPEIHYVIGGIILLCALLLALSMALADGAGDVASPARQVPGGMNQMITQSAMCFLPGSISAPVWSVAASMALICGGSGALWSEVLALLDARCGREREQNDK